MKITANIYKALSIFLVLSSSPILTHLILMTNLGDKYHYYTFSTVKKLRFQVLSCGAQSVKCWILDFRSGRGLRILRLIDAGASGSLLSTDHA